MNKKRIIRKVLRLLLWLVVLSGMTTLLVAANSRKTEHVCRKVLVSVKGPTEKIYIEEQDILAVLKQTSRKSLVNQPLGQIPLRTLEKELEKNQWIRQAQLYFDREDVLHVNVEEREPIGRVFTTLGSSFYIDTAAHIMPLLDKVTARVPVVTGFTSMRITQAKDSALLQDVKTVCAAIYADPFWNAQIGQIDMVENGKFELIPVIGDHVIRIGTAGNLEDKLHNLLLFYKQVMRKTGFNRYGVVDAQFAGQVLGIQKGAVSAVDSIQLQKNIESLLQTSTIQNVSADMLPDGKPAADSTIKQTMTVKPAAVPVKTDPNPPVPVKANPAPAAKPRASTATTKPTVSLPKKPAVPLKPKAVMKKKTAANKTPAR